MATEQMKEWREWGTFALTLLTVVAIPVGALILRNQRLEIAAECDHKYATQAMVTAERAEREAGDQSTWRRLGETNGKLDTVIVQQASMLQTVLDLKEEVRGLKKQ